MLVDRNGNKTRWDEYQRFLKQRELVLSPQTYRVVRELSEYPAGVFFRTGSAESAFYPDDLDFYTVNHELLQEFLSTLGFTKLKYGSYFCQLIDVDIWELTQYSRKISQVIDKIHIQVYDFYSFVKKQEVMRQYYLAQRFLRVNKACHKAYQGALMRRNV